MHRVDDLIVYSGSNCPFSNDYLRDIVIKGKTFCSVDHFFAYCKAITFEDWEQARNIQTALDVKGIYRLGRIVKEYSEVAWGIKRVNIMRIGMMAKFTQHKDLSQMLIDTNPCLLAEANGHDKFWSCGVSIENDDVYKPSKWTGGNINGLLLMEVRTRIIDLIGGNVVGEL